MLAITPTPSSRLASHGRACRPSSHARPPVHQASSRLRVWGKASGACSVGPGGQQTFSADARILVVVAEAAIHSPKVLPAPDPSVWAESVNSLRLRKSRFISPNRTFVGDLALGMRQDDEPITKRLSLDEPSPARSWAGGTATSVGGGSPDLAR